MSTPAIPVETIEPNVPAVVEPAAPQEPEVPWWEQNESVDTPPQAAATEYFLRAETGTVYKTADEAARGVAEKDRLIAAQRAEIDRMRQGVPALPAQPQQPQASQSSLVKVLEAAVQRGDMTFDQAVKALSREEARQETQAQLQPFMSLVEHATMSRAIEQAAVTYDPNIPAFVRSPAYAKTLAKWPALRTALQTAVQAPHLKTEDGRTFGEMVPEFLAQAYMVAKSAAPTAPTQRTPPQTSTPPQTVAPGAAPQGYTPPQSGFRDPFQEAWAQVTDRPLSKEFLGG